MQYMEHMKSYGWMPAGNNRGYICSSIYTFCACRGNVQWMNPSETV